MVPSETLSIIRQLMTYSTVTPDPGAALDYLGEVLTSLGFRAEIITCHGVPNLYAVRPGSDPSKPHLCFAGHTDVVPPGDGWRHDPFGAVIEDDFLYGRGAVDMKGAIGCFIGALQDFLQVHPHFDGAISILLTGDEEGTGHGGTRAVLEELQGRQGVAWWDGCIIGEPAGTETIADTVKMGRRGSVSFHVQVTGIQGHVAYPHLALNPIPALVRCLAALTATTLDDGMDDFPPSHLEVVSVRAPDAIGDGAPNVIPASASATLNVRFNPLHTVSSVTHHLTTLCQGSVGVGYGLAINQLPGASDPFLSPRGTIQTAVINAITHVTGRPPRTVTTGGTSDGRFLVHIAPLIEVGLSSALAHHVDERVALTDLATLQAIYYQALIFFFEGAGGVECA